MYDFDIKVRFRVYYKGTQFPELFFYTDTYDSIDDAIEYLKYLQGRDDFVDGHIKEEITRSRIVE